MFIYEHRIIKYKACIFRQISIDPRECIFREGLIIEMACFQPRERREISKLFRLNSEMLVDII